jgi:hypothetical protein
MAAVLAARLRVIFLRCRGFLITDEKELGSWRQFSSNLVTIVDIRLHASPAGPVRRPFFSGSRPGGAMKAKNARHGAKERGARCLAELLDRAEEHGLARINVIA